MFRSGTVAREVLAAQCAAALLVFSAPCLATSTFPAELKSHWRVGELPVSGLGCMLCHQNDLGGTGTATQKFALTLKRYGLHGLGDTAALDKALDQDKKNGDDSDGDGFSDYEELAVDGTNPSDKNSHKTPVKPPPEGGSGGASSGIASAGEGGSIDAAPECIPAQTIYPAAQYGCAVSAGSSRNAGFLSLFLLGLLRHRRRARRARRSR